MRYTMLNVRFEQFPVLMHARSPVVLTLAADRLLYKT